MRGCRGVPAIPPKGSRRSNGGFPRRGPHHGRATHGEPAPADRPEPLPRARRSPQPYFFDFFRNGNHRMGRVRVRDQQQLYGNGCDKPVSRTVVHPLGTLRAKPGPYRDPARQCCPSRPRHRDVRTGPAGGRCRKAHPAGVLAAYGRRRGWRDGAGGRAGRIRLRAAAGDHGRGRAPFGGAGCRENRGSTAEARVWLAGVAQVCPPVRDRRRWPVRGAGRACTRRHADGTGRRAGAGSRPACRSDIAITADPCHQTTPLN